MNERTPEGWYSAKLIKTEDEYGDMVWFIWDQNSNGKPYLRARVELLDGPNAGARRRIQMYLTPEAWPYTLKKLQNFGFMGSDIEQMEGQDPGQTVRVKIVHQERDGKVYEEIDVVAADGGGGGAKNPLSKDKRRHLAAQLRMMAGQQPAGVPAQKPAAPKNRAPWETDPNDKPPF